MRAKRDRNGNGTHRDDHGRFASNEGYLNRNSRRSYRDDRSYSNGNSNADAERYPISRSYDDYEDGQYHQSSYYRGGDQREWDSKGFSQFDRSDNDDFRSRNQRSGSYSGMYGRGNYDDFQSQNRRSSGSYGSDYNRGDNDYLSRERRRGNYSASMGANNGFGEYDIDHDDRDNRNSGMYTSSRKEGLYRGKGPKGYKRSDERIREDINDRLSDDYNLDASEIEVEVKNGEVTLSGTVSERSDKRRAEDVAESISGVSNVENRIRVSRSSSDSSSSTSSLSRNDSSTKTNSKSNERSKLHESVA